MHTCTCMVLTTPVKNACILSAKNAYGLVHARLCNGAEASLPWKLLRTSLESCASIVQNVVCHPPLLPLLLSQPNTSPDAVRSRNPSKSMPAHDCGVAQAWFDYPCWCRPHPVCLQVALALHFIQNSISAFFSREFQYISGFLPTQHEKGKKGKEKGSLFETCEGVSDRFVPSCPQVT